MRKKQTKASVRFAVAAMERATAAMPSETRDRYHDELVAEMHGLSARGDGATPSGSPRPRMP